MKSEIRKHYFEERYVIFAPKRSLRPQELLKDILPKPSLTESDAFDPAAQKKEKPSYEVMDDNGNWLIRAVPNKFSAVSLDNPKAYGTQEIIIETPEHGVHLNDLSIHNVTKVFEAYQNRINELRKLPRIKYVTVFKNEGGKAGASVNHSHSQVYALSIIPPQIQHEAMAFEDYLLHHGRCPYCDIIKIEIKETVRIVYLDEHVIAFCPYASTAPYGVWIMPRNHLRTIDDLSQDEEWSMAKALKQVLSTLETIDLSYNYFIQNSLDLENEHFIIKIEPRPNTWAGFELSTGIVINSVFPEEAAKIYRKKLFRVAGHPSFQTGI